MAKINLDDALLARARDAAAALGYSSVEELVAHCVEKELKGLKLEEAEDKVAQQLRGLGYIE
jgi:hypothetical protein